MAFDTQKANSWWLILLQLSVSSLFVVAQLSEQENSEPPYIIYAELQSIKKMNLDGTGIETIHATNGFIIIGLDYHHRLNEVYWLSRSFNSRFSFIHKKSLNTQIQDFTQLTAIYGIAAGLAVDWINDKIYWTVGHKIMVYDLVANTKADTATLTGTPLGIGVFPHKNNAWLYFMERGRRDTGDSVTNALVRMSINGGSQAVLNKRHIECPNAIAMDYPNTNVYWNDACRKRIEVVRIDGTRRRRIYDGNEMLKMNAHSKGIAYYDRVIYWTDTTEMFIYNTTTNSTRRFYSPESNSANGIRIVHSSLQPTEDQLQLYEMCTSIQCIHGQCLSNTSLCACNPGWSGDACDQDINECEVNNGGCEQTCTNTVGSFQCKCHEGQTLENNKRNCSGENGTQSPTPTPTTATQLPSSQPTHSANPLPDPSTDPISIPSSTTTSSLARDHMITTESIPVTSSSSDSTDTMPTEESTNDKKAEQPITDLNHGPKTTPTQQLRPTPTPVLHGLRPNRKEAEGSSNDLLIIIVSTVTGTVVFASVFCYALFLYCKISRRRRGSYDVNKSVNKRKRASDVESATSSARSSFRAVSEHHYSPNLENQFLRQALPGSTSSMSNESNITSVAPATSSESVSASSSAASESSAVSESQPLRLDSCKR